MYCCFKGAGRWQWSVEKNSKDVEFFSAFEIRCKVHFYCTFFLVLVVHYGMTSPRVIWTSSIFRSFHLNSVTNSERNCAHVSTFQTLVAQKIPKWRIFLCTRNKIQKLFPYELNLFFRKIWHLKKLMHRNAIKMDKGVK